MNTLTPAEQALVCQLVAQFRLEMLRAIANPPPKSNLTAEGRAKYAADANLAGAILDKLMHTEAA